MRELFVSYKPVEAVQVRQGNPRIHSNRQIRQIMASIAEFGFTNPILADDNDVIIAGHGRLEAAKRLGLATVPVIELKGLTEAQKRALVVADNKLALNASWDPELLVEEIQALVNIDFDVELTGFGTTEIDILLGHDAVGVPDVDDADEVLEPDRGAAPVSQAGDLWRLGDHRLYCGDALDPSSYSALLGDEKAEMVFTDPPYNVPIDGHARGLGRLRHREFAMASGEMSDPEYIEFLRSATGLLARFSGEGSIHFVCMDWRHLFALLSAAGGILELKNLCVWCKTNGGMGSLYRSQHELVAVFKHGRAPHINNVELGKRGRYRTNVWHYAGVNSFRAGRAGDLEVHPTVKPIRLVADAILDCSKVNGLVLDPFAGSGTTILACERSQRRAAAIEIDPYYVDAAIRRFEKMTCIHAVDVATGSPFKELCALRAAQMQGASRDQ